MDLPIIIELGQKTIKKTDVEIVQHLADDHSVPQIAELMNLKTRTLEGRIAKIRAKTGLKTAAALVAYFYKNGWLQ